MASRKSPAFSFYPDSWLGGTAVMTYQEKGVYIELLAIHWTYGRFSLSQVSNAIRSDSHDVMKRVLELKFEQDESGNFYNARLEEEKEGQERRKQAATENGKKGGRKTCRGGGYVYALQRQDSGLVKLGLSKDPANRRSQIRSRIKAEVELLAVWQVSDMEVAESVCHGHFASSRRQYEWFAISAKEIKSQKFQAKLQEIGAVDVSGSFLAGANGTYMAGANGTHSDSDSVSDSVSVLDSDSVSDSKVVKGGKRPTTQIERPTGIPETLWREWLAVRRAKRSGPVTATAWAAIEREADNARISPAEAVTIAVENSWASFKAAWHSNNQQRNRANGKQTVEEATRELMAEFDNQQDFTLEQPKGLAWNGN